MFKKIILIITTILTSLIFVYAANINSCFISVKEELIYNFWIGNETNECGENLNNLTWSCPANWSLNTTPKSNHIIVFNKNVNRDSFIDKDFEVNKIEVEKGYTSKIAKVPEANLSVTDGGIILEDGSPDFGNMVINTVENPASINLQKLSIIVNNDELSRESIKIINDPLICPRSIYNNISKDFRTVSSQPLQYVGKLFDIIYEKKPIIINDSLFNIAIILLLILNLIFGIFINKKKESYGYVRDKVSKEPIAFATVEMLLGESENLSYRGIVDYSGRYSFPVIPGSYRIRINKKGYIPYTNKVVISRLEFWRNYIGDIELIPEESKIYIPKKNLSSLLDYKIMPVLRKIYPLLILLGIYFIFEMYHRDNTDQIYLFVIQTVYFFLVFFYFINFIKPKPMLIEVINSFNGYRVPDVLVKIFDIKTTKLLDTKITNHDGYFESSRITGKNLVYIYHPGFIFPSSEGHNPNDETLIDNKKFLIFDFNTWGRTKTIYLDPIITNE